MMTSATPARDPYPAAHVRAELRRGLTRLAARRSEIEESTRTSAPLAELISWSRQFASAAAALEAMLGRAAPTVESSPAPSQETLRRLTADAHAFATATERLGYALRTLDTLMVGRVLPLLEAYAASGGAEERGRGGSPEPASPAHHSGPVVADALVLLHCARYMEASLSHHPVSWPELLEVATRIRGDLPRASHAQSMRHSAEVDRLCSLAERGSRLVESLLAQANGGQDALRRMLNEMSGVARPLVHSLAMQASVLSAAPPRAVHGLYSLTPDAPWPSRFRRFLRTRPSVAGQLMADMESDHGVVLETAEREALLARWLQREPGLLLSALTPHSGARLPAAFKETAVIERLFERLVDTDPWTALTMLDVNLPRNTERQRAIFRSHLRRGEAREAARLFKRTTLTPGAYLSPREWQVWVEHRLAESSTALFFEVPSWPTPAGARIDTRLVHRLLRDGSPRLKVQVMRQLVPLMGSASSASV